jgi:glycosyltransferase involved in cell wall biosynthesis
VDLTVTVVDDGSRDPDAVRRVVESFGDSRIGLLRHDTPQGVGAARNTGIAGTSSEWVALCDDDDVWAPEKLSAQIEAAERASAGWAYTGDVAIDGSLHVLSGAPPLPPAELVEGLERYNPVPAGSSNVLIRRRVLERVGVFDASLRSVADWDLWIRLARHGTPACVPRPFVGCRVHGITITRNRRLMLSEVGIVARRHRAPVDWPQHYRWAAWNSMLERQRLEAIEHYAHAVAHGDVLSIGRAVVALVYPRAFRQNMLARFDGWTADADTWLGRLREA